MELKQLEYQKETNEKFDKVFECIEEHAESEQIFLIGKSMMPSVLSHL